MKTKHLYAAAFALLVFATHPIAAYAGDVVVAPDGAGGADDIIDNTVDSADILDGTITSTDIGADTITAGNIAAGAVGTSEILDATITNTDVAADTLTAGNIAAGAVGTSEILDATITSTDIAADTITAGNIAAGAVGTSEITDGSVGLVDLDPAVTASFGSAAAINSVSRRVDDVEAGVAMAMAMSSTTHVPGKKFSFSLGLGAFQGETAASGKFSFAPTNNVVVSLGAATGGGEYGGAAGVAFGW